MTKPYYECHITILGESKSDKVKVEKSVLSIGWTFSAIDKDIVLGDGVKCYATRHFNIRYDERNMEAMVMGAKYELESHGLKVIRCKIEKVLFDERYK